MLSLYLYRRSVFKVIDFVFRGGGHAACGHAPFPRNVRKHFLTRYTVKNVISNLSILPKSALKMQEMPFQGPKFQKISVGARPRTPLELCRHYGLPLTKILSTPLFLAKVFLPLVYKYGSLSLMIFLALFEY